MKSILETIDLVKYYGDGDSQVRAIDHTSIAVQHGEFVAVVGRSGSGKSTLLHMLGGLDRPDSGKVIIGGNDIFLLKDEQLAVFRRRKIGFIFQDYNLIPALNVWENIVLPIGLDGKRVEQKFVMDIIESIGLTDKLKALPNMLSGGQKQRVAIARVLANNPKILLCDEATSALDPQTTKSILRLIKEINRDYGITVIVITHEMAVIEAICDRVAIIDSSHIAEVGTVSEIFSEPKSRIGRQLILGDAVERVDFGNARQIRITFDGRESTEPVISNLVLACKVPINIMYAATRDIGGKAMGQMIVQLPEGEADAARVIHYLQTVKIPFEEVTEHDV